jgi:hypothetical protein
LNDSKEYELAVDIAARILEQRRDKADNRFDVALFNVLEESLTHSSELEVYVSSFSRNEDQLSQWRAYCPAAGGFAVGFNAIALIGVRNKGQNRFLARCVYDSTKQKQIVDKAINTVLEFADQIHKIEGHQDRVLREAYKLFGRVVPLLAPALKDPSFSEENEWRLVSFPESFGDVTIGFRPGRSTLVPYYEHRLSQDNLPMPIDELIVGPTPHVELARHAAQELLSANGLDSVTVSSSSIPYRTW